MLKGVQGMGVPVEELGISQVSMNLLNVKDCPSIWRLRRVRVWPMTMKRRFAEVKLSALFPFKP